MTESPRWTAGLHCGPARDRDQYTLVRYRQTGGEGELWQATRRARDGEAERCAVKILALPAADDTPEGRDLWLRRWEDSIYRAGRVRTGGLVVPSACFVGARPHPAGAAADGDVLYLVSPWLDAETLSDWAKFSDASLEQRLATLTTLCHTVDELHRAGLVHRDISGANVLVDASGNPHLIDFTSLAPLGREVTRALITPGYAVQNEERSGALPSEAKDRFAIGVLAREMLLATPIPNFDVAAVTHRQLLDHGYDEAVADWLVQALAPDPQRRPHPLALWAQRLSELVADSERRPDYSCVALCGDGRLAPIVVSGGRRGVGYHLPADDGEPSDGLPSRRAAPRAVRGIAAVRNGAGQSVIAATDSGGTLWLGSADRWTVLTRGAEGVAMLTSPRGEPLVWTVHGGELSLYRVSLDGDASRQAISGRQGSRVVAAAWHGKVPVVLTAESARLVAHRWPLEKQGDGPTSELVLAASVSATAFSAGRSGELEALVWRADGSVCALRRHFSGEWLERSLPQPALRSGTEMVASMASMRGGAALACANEHGLQVLIPVAQPETLVKTTLSDRPTSAVALCQGYDWRLRVAAIVDGEICYWAESWDGAAWNLFALEQYRPSQRNNG